MGQIVGMEQDGRAGRSPDLADARDVVDVRVGQPDRGNRTVAGRGFAQEAIGLFSGIHQHGVRVIRIEDQVAVFLEDSVGNRDDFEPSHPIRPRQP